jgi:RNA polymerase sigma-70 factor, ECF subfamily
VDLYSDLLKRARHYDQDALAEIYDTFSPRLFRYAWRLTGQEDLAEECMAEVFGRFLSALNSGGGPQEHLQAYLYRIAHNWVTDQYRRQPPPPLNLESELLADGTPGPPQAAAEALEREHVRACLLRLTPEQRQVVVLKYYENFTNEQVAAALGKPVGAVKSLQHRALAALRRILLVEETIDETV